MTETAEKMRPEEKRRLKVNREVGGNQQEATGICKADRKQM
ncbi:MAG: hypothetical protein ACYSTF_10165 [Planctomycetota bacterium]